MSVTAPPACNLTGWHPCWEENVYGKGRQLNRYPYQTVVSFVLSTFGRVEDRSAVRILELGFGAGNNLWFAAREGFTVAGIEGSPTAVRHARTRFSKEGLTGDLRDGDFATLPWPDESFDMVLDRQALAHTTREVIDRALAEVQRVLKPGGKLLSLIYSDDHPDKARGTHRGSNDYDDFTSGSFAGLGTVHFVSRSEIDELFGSRFTITSLNHVTEVEELDGSNPIKARWEIQCVKTR